MDRSTPSHRYHTRHSNRYAQPSRSHARKRTTSTTMHRVQPTENSCFPFWKSLSAVVVLFAVGITARWHYEHYLLAALPACVFPGATQDFSSLVTDYATTIIPLLDPFSLPDSTSVITPIDALDPPCLVPKVYLQPEDLLLDFAAELTALCQCVPTSGMHTHLLSLCEVHAQTFPVEAVLLRSRQSRLKTPRIYSAGEHLRIDGHGVHEVFPAGVANLAISGLALTDLDRAFPTGFRPDELSPDSPDPQFDPDATRMTILASKALWTQISDWLHILDHGQSVRRSWVENADPDLTAIVDVVEGLESRQSYIVDWAKRHVPLESEMGQFEDR